MSSRHAQLSMVVIVGYSLFQLRSPGPAGNRFRRFPFGSCIGRFDEFSDQNHLVDGVTPSLKANARRELYRMRRLHYEFFCSYFLFSFPKLARQVCQMLSSLRSAGRRHRKKRTCRRPGDTDDISDRPHQYRCEPACMGARSDRPASLTQRAHALEAGGTLRRESCNSFSSARSLRHRGFEHPSARPPPRRHPGHSAGNISRRQKVYISAIADEAMERTKAPPQKRGLYPGERP